MGLRKKEVQLKLQKTKPKILLIIPDRSQSFHKGGLKRINLVQPGEVRKEINSILSCKIMCVYQRGTQSIAIFSF